MTERKLTAGDVKQIWKRRKSVGHLSHCSPERYNECPRCNLIYNDIPALIANLEMAEAELEQEKRRSKTFRDGVLDYQEKLQSSKDEVERLRTLLRTT